MQLKKYIKFKGITQAEAAAQIGIERQWLNFILNGKVVPGGKATRLIIKWAKGDIRYEDLVKS